MLDSAAQAGSLADAASRAPHGLTLPLFTAMSVQHARGSLFNAQLAERSFMSPQSANEIVKTMQAKGWVVREPDPMHGGICPVQRHERHAAAAGASPLRLAVRG